MPDSPVTQRQDRNAVRAKAGQRLTLATVVGSAVALALAPFIAHEESGREVQATLNADSSLAVRHISGKQYLQVYLDAVGVPTACDGITTYQGRPLRRGMRFTERQCAEMLESELIAHAVPAMNCTPGIARSSVASIEKRREGPRFLAVSLAYNVGVTNYCGSTAARLFNEGRYNEGCEAATRWNRAGGRVLRGLVNRRNREKIVCTEGLAALAKAMRA